MYLRTKKIINGIEKLALAQIAKHMNGKTAGKDKVKGEIIKIRSKFVIYSGVKLCSVTFEGSDYALILVDRVARLTKTRH